MKNIVFVITVNLLFVLSACNSGNSRLKIDVPEAPETNNINIDRLEQDVFNIDTADILGNTRRIQEKYGHFYTVYYTGILNNGGIKDSSYQYRIKQFIKDKDMMETFAECQKKYPNIDVLKQNFTEVYNHFKYYFPEKKLPRLVTMISGYNYPIVSIDSTLAIGLEMYLGADTKFYTWLGLPKYRTMFMDEQNILPDAVRHWMSTTFPNNMNKTDFLSEMIYMGKILYLTDALLPEVNDTLKIQYSSKQLEYCKQFEFNIWSYFVAEKLLYTTNQADIMKFTSDGPFTSAFSKDCPARVAHWIGWQIVRQYMDKNTDVTLQQLMSETDAQQVLIKSKYKPSK